MSSLDSLLVRKALAVGEVRQVGTDGAVALRIRHLGAESVTSVVVTSATGIVLTGSGTTDTITFAAQTTLGAVADFLNATGRWEVKVLDAKRSLGSDDNLVAGTIAASTDANGVTIWDIMVDSSVALQLAVCLSGSRDFDAPKRRVSLQQVVYGVNMGSAAVDSVQIWRRRGSVETQVFGALSVDTTETTLSLALGLGSIGGKDGDEFIVLVKDAATLADATSNLVRVVGVIE